MMNMVMKNIKMIMMMVDYNDVHDDYDDPGDNDSDASPPGKSYTYLLQRLPRSLAHFAN